ncbi:MAG: lipocalin family protein [Desulfarculaceae bacterium]|nr:lipocalin family protein [Desulfarculaceae bacterium]
MGRWAWILPAMILALAVGCGGPQAPASVAVSPVELDRYLGRWYEIASFPAWFQKGCVCTTADYSRQGEELVVVNACRENSPQGEPRKARARAWVVDASGGGRLKVQFQWPFTGDYWIIGLDSAYRWAVVGTPDRDYLWILSRTPRLGSAQYQKAVQIAKQKGWPIQRLRRTLQDCDRDH